MLSFLTTFVPYLTWTFLCCFSQLIATTCSLEYVLILVPVSLDSVFQIVLLIVLYLECLCFPKIKQSLTFASLFISPAFHLISGSRIPSLCNQEQNVSYFLLVVSYATSLSSHSEYYHFSFFNFWGRRISGSH